MHLSLCLIPSGETPGKQRVQKSVRYWEGNRKRAVVGTNAHIVAFEAGYTKIYLSINTFPLNWTKALRFFWLGYFHPTNNNSLQPIVFLSFSYEPGQRCSRWTYLG